MGIVMVDNRSASPAAGLPVRLHDDVPAASPGPRR